MAFQRVCLVLCAAACALLAGCTGGEAPTYKTTGKVVENGQPVNIPRYREGYNCLQVDFYPVEESGALKNAPHAAAFPAEDGTFTVSGEKGKGIPAGKYRVAVRRVDRTKTVQPDAAGNIDAWNGKFSEKTSPFVVDVPSQSEIVIDIAKAPAAAPAKK